MKRINWAIWVALIICFASMVLYPFFLVDFPVTRDFPWVNLLLFIATAVLLFIGLRRAFRPGGRLRSKIAASVVSVVCVALMGLFVFSFFIAARWLPESKGAPHAGQKAPEFTLTDTEGKQVGLSELLTTPINGQPPKGVLLIFYRVLVTVL